MKTYSVWDILTILTLGAIFVLVVVVAAIFVAPTSALNPFPVPTPVSTLVISTGNSPETSKTTAVTPEATLTLPPTETPAPSATMTPSPLPTQTITPMVSVTITGTATHTLTPTLTSTVTTTGTVTQTRTPTKIVSVTSSVTPTLSKTPTKTSTITKTLTPTRTFTPTATVTLTKTVTFTLTASFTPSLTSNVPATLTFTPRPPTLTYTPSSSGGCDGGNSSFESALLSMVNYQREQAGVAPLSASSALTSAARSHSQDMAVNNFFSHTGSNGSSPFDRMAAAGFSFSYAAENIYAGSGSNNNPGSAVSAWMGSEGHKTNMLNPIYTHAGVGYWCNSSSEYGGYFTLDLAKP